MKFCYRSFVALSVYMCLFCAKGKMIILWVLFSFSHCSRFILLRSKYANAFHIQYKTLSFIVAASVPNFSSQLFNFSLRFCAYFHPMTVTFHNNFFLGCVCLLVFVCFSVITYTQLNSIYVNIRIVKRFNIALWDYV